MWRVVTLITAFNPGDCDHGLLIRTCLKSWLLKIRINFTECGKCASLLLGTQNCLSDAFQKLWTPHSPHFFPISVTFGNQWSDIHTHFTPRLAHCVKVRKEPGFELFSLAVFFHSSPSYFCPFYVNNRVQHYECLPWEGVRKCAPLSQWLDNITSPPSHCWPVNTCC